MSSSMLPTPVSDERGPYVFFFGDMQVRIKIIEGAPWFVAADVATALGYARPNDAYSQHVHSDDMCTTVIRRGTSGGNPNVTVVNESGLYSLIFGSKLATAKAFQRWVTSEVLPSIRKTGQYGRPQALSRRELAQMVIEAEDRAAAAELDRDAAWQTIERNAPKVNFVEHFVEPTSDACTVRVVAKELGIGEHRLWALLVAKKRVYRDPTDMYQPYAQWVTWFVLRDQPEAPRLHNGQLRTTLYVTPVGKEGIRRMLAKRSVD